MTLNPIDDTVHAFVAYPPVPVAHAPDGPLAGLTFAVKDLYDVAGYPTGLGNATRMEEAVHADVHAAVVADLLDAGASFAGKTHTVEFAYGMDGANEQLGTPVNPAAPDRFPGGSSSGSVAAVAAGLVDFALGSDTGGSVRVPASFCGLIGLRTTLGRISVAGVTPLSESADTVGWFARTPEIYERVGEVLLGEDDDQTVTNLLVATDAFAKLHGSRETEALAPALERVAALFEGKREVELSPDGFATWPQAFRTVQAFEAWRHHGAWIKAHPDALSHNGVLRFGTAEAVTEREYEDALAVRADARTFVTNLTGSDSVIALPTTPTLPPRLDAPLEEREAFRISAQYMTCAASLAGVPQISLPLADIDGVPMGLSLIGPPGRDRALIALARRLLG